MTMIAGIGFPDEVFIVSDSRVSYKNRNIAPKDNLKKIYQLSKYSCFAYTSEDVIFTHNLIEEITKFTTSLPDIKTDMLLKQVTKYASRKYQEISDRLKKSPTMYFIYVGMIDKPYKIETRKLKTILKIYNNKTYIPDKIKIPNLKSKFTLIPSPTPLLIKQSFPDGKTSSSIGWDFSGLGSGKNVEFEIDKFYTKLFFFPGTFNKAVIIKDICDHYIGQSKINTIGGLIQIFMIDRDGVKPLMFVKHGEGEEVRQYVDTNGDWVEENTNTGVIKRVKQNL